MWKPSSQGKNIPVSQEIFAWKPPPARRVHQKPEGDHRNRQRRMQVDIGDVVYRAIEVDNKENGQRSVVAAEICGVDPEGRSWEHWKLLYKSAHWIAFED
jgi:hypothetical protein